MDRTQGFTNVSWCFHACDYFQVPERIQPVNRPCHEIKNNSAALSGGVVVLDFFVCNDSETETICLILTYIGQLTFKYFVEQMGLPSTYRGSFVSFYRNGTGDLLLLRVVGQTRPQTRLLYQMLMLSAAASAMRARLVF